jgi:hypothetical protein
MSRYWLRTLGYTPLDEDEAQEFPVGWLAFRESLWERFIEQWDAASGQWMPFEVDNPELDFDDVN